MEYFSYKTGKKNEKSTHSTVMAGIGSTLVKWDKLLRLWNILVTKQVKKKNPLYRVGSGCVLNLVKWEKWRRLWNILATKQVKIYKKSTHSTQQNFQTFSKFI